MENSVSFGLLYHDWTTFAALTTCCAIVSHYFNTLFVRVHTLDLVPGWRLGWIVFQDNQHGSIQEVKRGAQRLAQVILGSSHLAQVAIEAALNSDQESTALWKKHLYSTIEMQAKVLCGMLNDCCGLDVIFPNGGESCLAWIMHLLTSSIFPSLHSLMYLLQSIFSYVCNGANSSRHV